MNENHDANPSTTIANESGTVTVPEAVPTRLLAKTEEEVSWLEHGRNGFKDRTFRYLRVRYRHDSPLNEHGNIA